MDKDQLQTYSLSLTKNLIESAKNRALELGLTYGLNPSVSLYVRRLIEKDVMESKLKILKMKQSFLQMRELKNIQS